ncbi:riboflavin synthase [Rhizosphaericola mali]|uniref:Riboflavin synthase n=1 Tax=Rhizosphaericola mali TaxID=2545455 RepID=A0A5P2G7U0_9BACT|nr:riboflavin synthase [Rhizosphaericola mali]QES90349.1 riboflavin synthase [Rhizosphaericola mali]
MFTGIIESTGAVLSVEVEGTNKHFWIESSKLTPELSIDQSVSHQGVCLTVDQLKETSYRVTAIEETLKKTNLNDWKTGTIVNLERCMQMNGRLDGHIVQGHVDTTAVCTNKSEKNGSVEFTFRFPLEFASLVIEKGSISVNGTSLTLFNVGTDTFTVAIIPYTYDYTSISQVEIGTHVNIEFDILGKYIQRNLALNK